MAKVAIVILNWNGIDDTKQALRDIAKLDKKGIDVEVVIVDNNSTKGVVELKKLSSKHKLIVNKNNLGFAGGNNVGIRYSIGLGVDYVLVLNNDVLLDKKSLSEMVGRMEKDVSIGALSPKIYFAKGYEFHKERYSNTDLGKIIWYAGGRIDWENVYGMARGVDEIDTGQYNFVSATDFATGTCMLLRSSVLKKVGFFNEKYFLYYEDTDLSQRIKMSGFKVVYFPDAVIWHKVAQSSGIGSNLNDYYISRNRLLFGFKYAKIRTKVALLKESLQLLLKGRAWQKMGVRDFYMLRFGKGSWE